MDSIENVSSNIFLVVSHNCLTDLVEKNFLVKPCCLLPICFLATSAFAGPFSSSGSVCLPHTTYFEQIIPQYSQIYRSGPVMMMTKNFATLILFELAN
jgi:hypothetical protein